MPASVTKVMTAFTAFRLIDEGTLSPGMRFQYTDALEEAWYGEGSNMFLKAGEQPTIGQLLLGVTTVSGNDASVALAVAGAGSLEKWLALMNTDAARLGMSNTHFGSPNGFPDSGRTYSSARDLVLLGEAITQRYPGLYRRYFGHRELAWRDIRQRNHDPVTGRVAGADGLKTGYTNEAGFTFLGSAARGDRRLMMVLAGAPTSAVRDDTARALLEWGFANFETRALFAKGSRISSAVVQNGDQRSVELVAGSDVDVALPKGAKLEDLILKSSYRGPLTAPVAQGDRVGTLHIAHGGELPARSAADRREHSERGQFRATHRQCYCAVARLMRGRFITLEGGEGVGKSTQCALLAQALRDRDISVLLTREPGGTPGAEAIRALLLEKTHDWNAKAECLLFAAARSDHVANAIEPALAGGKWVVCDRFVDSSRAYQAGEGGLHDADILAAHKIGSGGLMPDCTILLEANQDTLRKRLAARDGDGADRIGGRPAAFHRKVAHRFQALAAAEPARFVSVQAEGAPDEVHHRIMAALAPLLDAGT